jgi:glycosyltransferase involved in cell wall biosynthesis
VSPDLRSTDELLGACLRKSSPTSVSLGVVVPAHQARATLPACLGALIAAGFRPEVIIVVDDGSRDGTAAAAEATGARVLRNPVPLGASDARNRGAVEIKADVVLFVDADVVVHPGIRARIEAAFADPEVTAVFGSYDDLPPQGGLVAKYRNLLHHYVHQRSRREASTFWTGLGAVRRDAFLSLRGFHKEWEQIEDAELGVRLHRAGGRIRLDPDLLCTHLKAWTLRTMVRTDLIGRAVPWARLILFANGPRDDLNMSVTHKVSAASVAVLGLSLLSALANSAWLGVAVVAIVAFLGANAAFLRFLAARLGVAAAIAALPIHALHYCCGGFGFAWVLFIEGLARRRPGFLRVEEKSAQAESTREASHRWREGDEVLHSVHLEDSEAVANSPRLPLSCREAQSRVLRPRVR